MADYSSWLDQLLDNLDRSGPEGHAARRFLADQRIRVDLRHQPTGARWTVTRRIQLHPRCAEGAPNAPYPLSLIIHEIRHLRQRWIAALSVQGELQAWQAQFAFFRSLTGRYHELAYREGIIRDLMSLSCSADRQALSQARDLMRAYAGKSYRIDLLPFYPLHNEILFLLTGGKISSL
jgi:hypothetical protein